jgi:hypothetical protein
VEKEGAWIVIEWIWNKGERRKEEEGTSYVHNIIQIENR